MPPEAHTAAAGKRRRSVDADLPRDGDLDGKIYDGKWNEQPAPTLIDIPNTDRPDNPVAAEVFDTPGRQAQARLAGGKNKGKWVNVTYGNTDYALVASKDADGNPIRGKARWDDFDKTRPLRRTQKKQPTPARAQAHPGPTPERQTEPTASLQEQRDVLDTEWGTLKLAETPQRAELDSLAAHALSVRDRYTELLDQARTQQPDLVDGLEHSLATISAQTTAWLSLSDDIAAISDRLADNSFKGRATRELADDLAAVIRIRSGHTLASAAARIAKDIETLGDAETLRLSAETLRSFSDRYLTKTWGEDLFSGLADELADRLGAVAATAPHLQRPLPTDRSTLYSDILQTIRSAYESANQVDGPEAAHEPGSHGDTLRKLRDYYLALGDIWDREGRSEAHFPRDYASSLTGQLDALFDGNPPEREWVPFEGYETRPRTMWEPGYPVPDPGNTLMWDSYMAAFQTRLADTPLDTDLLDEYADALFVSASASPGLDDAAQKRLRDLGNTVRADRARIQREATEAAAVERSRVRRRREIRRIQQRDADPDDRWGQAPDQTATYREAVGNAENGRLSAFAYDGDKIEGFNVRTRRVRKADQTGETLIPATEYQFRARTDLTGESALTAFMADAEILQKRTGGPILRLQMEYAGELQPVAGSYENDRWGAGTRVKQFQLADGTNVEVRYHHGNPAAPQTKPGSPTQNDPTAFIGLTQVWVDGDTPSQDQFDEIMETIGIRSPQPDVSYQTGHTAPTSEGVEEFVSASADDITNVYPNDFWDNPKIYMFHPDSDPEVLEILRRVQGDPDAEVTIYRALAPEHAEKGINRGDWVSLSRTYAAAHGIQDEDPRNDWPVISKVVPAKHVFTNGDSLSEWGYDPGIEPPSGTESYPAADQVDAYKRSVLRGVFGRPDIEDGAARAEREFGITVDDVQLETINGRIVPTIPDDKAEQIAERIGVGWFVHELYPGVTAETIADMVTGEGLLASAERLTSGRSSTLGHLTDGGMSVEADIATGGANFVFTRPHLLRYARDFGETNERAIAIDARVALRRLDWFAWTSDGYGSVLAPRQDWLENVATGTGETMFRGTIPVEDWDSMKFESPEFRSEVLAALRSRGVTEINGVPVEHFVGSEFKPRVATSTSPADTLGRLIEAVERSIKARDVLTDGNPPGSLDGYTLRLALGAQQDLIRAQQAVVDMDGGESFAAGLEDSKRQLAVFDATLTGKLLEAAEEAVLDSYATYTTSDVSTAGKWATRTREAGRLLRDIETHIAATKAWYGADNEQSTLYAAALDPRQVESIRERVVADAEALAVTGPLFAEIAQGRTLDELTGPELARILGRLSVPGLDTGGEKDWTKALTVASFGDDVLDDRDVYNTAISLLDQALTEARTRLPLGESILKTARTRLSDRSDEVKDRLLPDTIEDAENSVFVRLMRAAAAANPSGQIPWERLRSYYDSLGRVWDSQGRTDAADVAYDLAGIAAGHARNDLLIPATWVPFDGFETPVVPPWRPGRTKPDVSDSDNWARYVAHLDDQSNEPMSARTALQILDEQMGAVLKERAAIGPKRFSDPDIETRYADLEAKQTVLGRRRQQLIETEQQRADGVTSGRVATTVTTDRPVGQRDADPGDKWGQAPDQTATFIEAADTAHTGTASAFAYDGDALEGFNVRRRQTRYAFDTDPVAATQFQFRVRGADKQESVSSWMQDGGEQLDGIVLQREIDGVLERDATGFSFPRNATTGGAVTTIKPVTLSDGTRAEIRYHLAADRDSPIPAGISKQGSPYSLIGLTQIVVEGNLTQDQMDEIMGLLDITPGYPTGDAARVYKERLLGELYMRSPDEWLSPADGPVSNDTYLAKGLEIAASKGITPDDITLETINGRVVPRVPDSIADQTRTEMGTEWMSHTFSGSVKADSIAAIVANNGLLSTVQRRTRGSNRGVGISEEADTVTGGADYVFLRPDAARGSASRVVIKSEAVARRVDWFAYRVDRYGTRRFGLHDQNQVSGSFAEIQAASESGEVMVRDTLPLSDWEMIVVPHKELREKLLNSLYDRGITEVNGVPVEEFVVDQFDGTSPRSPAATVDDTPELVTLETLDLEKTVAEVTRMRERFVSDLIVSARARQRLAARRDAVARRLDRFNPAEAAVQRSTAEQDRRAALHRRAMAAVLDAGNQAELPDQIPVDVWYEQIVKDAAARRRVVDRLLQVGLTDIAGVPTELAFTE